MTGMTFSASFFTKDLYLEIRIIESKSFMKIVFIMTAGFITIIYCIKILKPLKEVKKESAISETQIMKPALLLLWALILTLPLITKTVLTKDFNPMLNIHEVIFLVLLLIILPLTVGRVSLKNLKFLNFTLRVGFIKEVIFSV